MSGDKSCRFGGIDNTATDVRSTPYSPMSRIFGYQGRTKYVRRGGRRAWQKWLPPYPMHNHAPPAIGAARAITPGDRRNPRVSGRRSGHDLDKICRVAMF